MPARFQTGLTEKDVTPQALYLNRREWLAATGLLAVSMAAPARAETLAGVVPGPAELQTDETPTRLATLTSYNNFYEFGTDKAEPAVRAPQTLRTDPWSVRFEGLCAKPGVVSYDDLLKPHTLEERIYRLRCVEGWSVVVPWIGIPLAEVIKRFEPLGSAKYVAFESLYDPAQMPDAGHILEWPYVEGLRMDEAMHPLTLLAVGLYGERLKPQNGAPVRLVVPWKYGFKSIKSIVRISFTEDQPPTSWNRSAPREYGFYSNVNPEVDHPRWSQATERRLGEFLRRKTLMFNGYAEQVAALYAGMDLRANF